MDAQTLSSWVGPAPIGDTVIARAFATGTLRAVATGKTSETNTADGTVGVNLSWATLSIGAVINVATSAQPVTSGFAQSLLSPGSGTGFKSGILELRRRNVLRSPIGPIGLHAYFSAASRPWSSGTDTTNTTVLGLGTLLYRQVEAASRDTSRIGFGIEAGVSLRDISGDIASSGADSLRAALLGSRTRLFIGFEGGMTITVNKLTAAIQIYHYFSPVQGVGHWQLTTGVSLQADVISFKSHPEDR
jgi:hypothetical protein